MHLGKMIGVLILLMSTKVARINAMSEADVMWEFHLALDDASNTSPFDGWTRNDDACEIQNVHCVDNTIRKILFSADVVSGPPIIGTLTPHLQHLTDLEVIDLSDQQMHGEVPSEWSVISTLTELSDLKNQEMHGTLPEEWSALTHLTTVRLGNNELTGTLPSSWKDLANLKDLILTRNLLSGSIPPSWSALNMDSFAVWGNQDLCGELPDGFADVDISDTNLKTLCPWTETPVSAPVSELDSVSSLDAEESLIEPFFSPEGEELDSDSAPEGEELGSNSAPKGEELDSDSAPGGEELGSHSALEEDHSSSEAPSSNSAAREPEEEGSLSVPEPEKLSPDILHEEVVESEIAPAREPSSLVSISSVDGSASASETLEDSACYEDIEVVGPLRSNASLTVVYITGSFLAREQCDVHCFVEAFVDTNATVIGAEKLQNGAIKTQLEVPKEGVYFVQYSPSALCQMDEATQRLEVIFDFTPPKVSLTLEERPGDLKSTFIVLATFSEEVSLTDAGLSEVLTLVQGKVLNIAQTESQMYSVEIQGVSGMGSSIWIANGSYTDLAGIVGSGAFLTVLAPEVLDSVITKTVDHFVDLSPGILAGSITLSLLTSVLSSGSTSMGIQSFGHLQILALVGQLALSEVPQSFVKSAGSLNWSLLDVALPWKLSALSTSMEESVKEDILHTTRSRRLASSDNGIPNEVLEDWTTIEHGDEKDLQSSTTEAVESSPQMETEDEAETIGALFWRQFVLFLLAILCALIVQTGAQVLNTWKHCRSPETAQKQQDAFPSPLLALFLTGVPVLMFSCTQVLSEDLSSVDTKISLTVSSIALLASIALFCFETRKRASRKKITPLERVTSVPEDLLEDTQTEASDITLLTNPVHQRARTVDPKDGQSPDYCYPQEQGLNQAVVEEETAFSECAPGSPRADPSIMKRPQNRWTSIEYQRKAQNKLLSFIKSVTGNAESNRDQEIREDRRSEVASKPLEVPRIEASLSPVPKEGPVPDVENSLIASPRSQHFLERCSSPDESPLLTARDPETKSPPVTTPRRDSLTTDEALLEQPHSTELQQTLLELPGDRSLSPVATWIPVQSPRHNPIATSARQREQGNKQNERFLSLDSKSEILFWSISFLRRCMIAFLVGFESFGANHKIIMLTTTQIVYTLGLFFTKDYPNQKLEHFCSFLEAGILISLAIIHWTGDAVITYPLLGCLIGEVSLITLWLLTSSLIKIKNSVVCCKGTRVVSN